MQERYAAKLAFMAAPFGGLMLTRRMRCPGTFSQSVFPRDTSSVHSPFVNFDCDSLSEE